MTTITPSDRQAPAPRTAASSSAAQAPRPIGEAFATARSGPQVPVLRNQGPGNQVISLGGSATLAVQSAPGAAVTFETRDGGVFPNGQASIRVIADDTGLARTTFTATPGTVDDVAILVGSPAATGTIPLLVHVLYPTSPYAAVSSSAHSAEAR